MPVYRDVPEGKKKLLLINPNYRENPLSSKQSLGIIYPNLGIDSLYTFLAQELPQVEVVCIDAVLDVLTEDEILARALASKPTHVGVSATYMTLDTSLRLLRGIKNAAPRTITILGGSGARSLEFLEERRPIHGLDYCVRGDGEYLLLDILKSDRTPPDTVYLQQTNLALDKLPFPERNSTDLSKYIDVFSATAVSPLNKGKRATNMYTSKGCGWGRCTYCSVENPFRLRSIENLRKEIEYLHSNFQINRLVFLDDNLASPHDPQRLLDIADLLSGFPEIEWFSEIRLGDIVAIEQRLPGTLERVRSSGCSEMLIGVESLDNRILKGLKKGVTSKCLRAGIEKLSQAGIRPKLLMMYNSPGETPETLQVTCDALCSLVRNHCIPLVSFSEYTYIPGCNGGPKARQPHRLDTAALQRFKETIEQVCAENETTLTFYSVT